MLVKATYIGENGAFNYQKGRVYQLWVVMRGDTPVETNWSPEVAVYAAENPTGTTSYRDIQIFFENWRLV